MAGVLGESADKWKTRAGELPLRTEETLVRVKRNKEANEHIKCSKIRTPKFN